MPVCTSVGYVLLRPRAAQAVMRTLVAERFRGVHTLVRTPHTPFPVVAAERALCRSVIRRDLPSGSHDSRTKVARAIVGAYAARSGSRLVAVALGGGEYTYTRFVQAQSWGVVVRALLVLARGASGEVPMLCPSRARGIELVVNERVFLRHPPGRN